MQKLYTTKCGRAPKSSLESVWLMIWANMKPVLVPTLRMSPYLCLSKWENSTAHAIVQRPDIALPDATPILHVLVVYPVSCKI